MSLEVRRSSLSKSSLANVATSCPQPRRSAHRTVIAALLFRDMFCLLLPVLFHPFQPSRGVCRLSAEPRHSTAERPRMHSQSLSCALRSSCTGRLGSLKVVRRRTLVFWCFCCGRELSSTGPSSTPCGFKSSPAGLTHHILLFSACLLLF